MQLVRGGMQNMLQGQRSKWQVSRSCEGGEAANARQNYHCVLQPADAAWPAVASSSHPAPAKGIVSLCSTIPAAPHCAAAPRDPRTHTVTASRGGSLAGPLR